MMARRILDLFRTYPRVTWLRPGFWGQQTGRQAVPAAPVIAVQLVPDSFYVVFFGALIHAIRGRLDVQVEGVVVRSINSGTGIGVRALLQRSALFTALYCRPWRNAFGRLMDRSAYCSNSPRCVADLRDWRRAGELWAAMNVDQDLLDLRVDGVLVGDLVVDTYLRYRPSPEFRLRDPFVRRVIWQALRDVRRAEDYFKVRKPVVYITSHTTYLEHGIAARVALTRGVDVWSFGSLAKVGKKISLSDPFHTPDASAYRTRFDQLPNQAELLVMADEQLSFRLSGGIDSATSYMRQSAYGQQQADLPSGLEGAVVVFLHDFYDSPHVYGGLVFPEFWRWICFTIDVLRESGIPFFLKPHPNQISLGASVLDDLKQRYQGLLWLDQSAGNNRLASAGIACGVTVYGTVAHELAYLGVPSIACARHPHHTFDFCRTAQTESEYRRLLQDYRSCSLDREEMRRQALAYYTMHNLLDQPQARQLQQKYAALWKACNDSNATGESVCGLTRAVQADPEFSRICDEIAAGRA